MTEDNGFKVRGGDEVDVVLLALRAFVQQELVKARPDPLTLLAEDLVMRIHNSEGAWNPEANLSNGLADAVRDFEVALPGWWWSVGYCKVSGDASCGPDRQGPDADLLEHKIFDEGFHEDFKGAPPTAALRTVMQRALKARQRFRKTAKVDS